VVNGVGIAVAIATTVTVTLQDCSTRKRCSLVAVNPHATVQTHNRWCLKLQFRGPNLAAGKLYNFSGAFKNQHDGSLPRRHPKGFVGGVQN
jgi:hypothetical protein